MHSHHGHRSLRAAFTLIELLVVVAIIALLISILLPSLQSAREQAKTVVCLSNLRSMGQAVAVYATGARDRLPSRIHPAVYRYQNKEYYEDVYDMTSGLTNELIEQQLTTFLRRTLNDSGVYTSAATDKIATCPKLAGLISDNMFVELSKTGNKVFPSHYAVNNWGSLAQEGDGAGAIGNARPTNPSYYFGYKRPPGTTGAFFDEAERKYPGRRLGEIKRAAEEWMLADAWFRERPQSSSPEFQQEGPYQSKWSGEVYAPFAPHGVFYSYPLDADARRAFGIQIRSSKGDGTTGTVFFDGHADDVRSRDYIVGSFGSILYGFPGTVNLAKERPNNPNHPVWTGYWD